MAEKILAAGEPRAKALAYLQIVRFPNLFTAIADILAGYFVAAGVSSKGGGLFFLVLSSVCIYAAGCVLNDFFDRETDGLERPFRPIPSGRISSGQALLMAVLLIAAGLFCAVRVGGASLLIALLLCAIVLLYNSFSKKFDVYGPLNMAGCRSLNLLLGMSTGLSWSGEIILFPLITLVYVFSLTVLSRFETGAGADPGRWCVLPGWAAVIFVIVALWRRGVFPPSGMAMLALLICWTGPALLIALVKPVPKTVGNAVKTMILCIPVLDAVYASSSHGLFLSLAIAAMALPAIVLSRYVYVT